MIAGIDDLRTHPGADAARLRKAVLWICAAAFLAGWLPRLFWGFWTDEAGTYWMAAEGWRAAIPRAQGWDGQSILYSVLESFFVVDASWVGPAREAILRIPSLAAMWFAALHLKRIGTILAGTDAGWIAAAALICAPDSVGFGTSARPYALALAASVASFRYLLEWRTSPRLTTVAKYLAASVLTIYLHYLFAFIFLIQAIYVAALLVRRQSVLWSLPLAAVVVLPLSLLPLLPSLRSTAHSGDFSYAAPPEFLDLLQTCFPPVFLLGLSLGYVLTFASGRAAAWRPTRPHPETIVLLAVWILVPACAFFAVSRWTPRSIFAARYLMFITPGIALCVAWAISGLRGLQARIGVVIAIFASAILHPGMLIQNWRPSQSSWREPLRWIAQQSPKAPPVFVASGMANTAILPWQTEDPHTSSLYSPLLAYPVPNTAIPLPYQFGPDAEAYIRATPLTESRYLLLAAADSELVSWMKQYMRQAGFEPQLHAFSDYVVVDFRRLSLRDPRQPLGSGL